VLRDALLLKLLSGELRLPAAAKLVEGVMSNVQLLIGGVSRYQDDYPSLRQTARRGGRTWCACGKHTKAGDILLMYFQRPHSGIIATARALGTAKPGRGWPYTAAIGNVKFLPNKISLDEIRTMFPRWRWHKYPRSHVYLDPHKANALLKRAKLKLKTSLVSVKVFGAGFGTPEGNCLVEKAACRAVKRYFSDRGYKVRSREKENIGYDFDVTSAKETLHIEVKGVSGNELSFPITSNEVKRAQTDKLFHLAVVTTARTAPRVKLFTAKEFLRRFNLKPLAYYATGH
jgi:hypothetical protein